MSERRRIKKSVWLPAVLTLYFLGMAIFFGPQLIRDGETLRFILVSIVEIIVIIAVHLFYKRKERQ